MSRGHFEGINICEQSLDADDVRTQAAVPFCNAHLNQMFLEIVEVAACFPSSKPLNTSSPNNKSALVPLCRRSFLFLC